jgi:hypothetical protein
LLPQFLVLYNSIFMRNFLQTLICILLPAISFAQETWWKKTDSLFKYVQPTASIQLWSIYTMNEMERLVPNGPLEPVSNRLNFSARRARIGFKGTPYKNFSYLLMLHYDNLGRDRFSATRAGVNDGQVGVIDAYMSWKISKKSDNAILTFGYVRPQISRESITGDLIANSFDKSLAQSYIRQHMVGKGFGRAMGLNVGGQKTEGKFGVNYNVGFFNNNTTGPATETAGKYWSPLLAGRLALTFGDPEMEKYSINYNINFFKKRKGITVALNGTSQARTDVFRYNHITGVDVLLNYNNLNIDGEWFWLDRNLEGTKFQAQTGHIRLGYNLIVQRKIFLEPVLMTSVFYGDTGGQFKGKDKEYNAGINWYLNKNKLKLSLHYVWQDGNGKNGFTDGVNFQKGNYAGLGFLLML